MTNSVTHFEIYAPNPSDVAEFYWKIFGWRIEQMPGVDYWRIDTGSAEDPTLSGGLTYRAISYTGKLAGSHLFQAGPCA